MVFLFGSDEEGNSYTITDLEADFAIGFTPEIITIVVVSIISIVLGMLTGVSPGLMAGTIMIWAYLAFWIYKLQPSFKSIIFFMFSYFYAALLYQGIDCDISNNKIRATYSLYSLIDRSELRSIIIPIIVLCGIGLIAYLLVTFLKTKSNFNIVMVFINAILCLTIAILFIILSTKLKVVGKTCVFFIVKSFFYSVVSFVLFTMSMFSRKYE